MLPPHLSHAPLGQSGLTHPKYRADIDGLRAVAVLSVVAFHAAPSFLRGGFVGVDIFFVISGYLISTIIFSNLESGTFSFKDFYVRRIKRIFPALCLVLCCVGLIGWAVLFQDEYAQLGKHVAAGAAFVSNLVLWSEAGYFDASADSKPLLHLWSLGIEEQFYIAWPLLAYLAYRHRFGLLIGAVLLIFGSFVLNIATIHDDPVAAFYSPLTRIWELSAGSALAWYHQKAGTRTESLGRSGSPGNWLASLGTILILTAIVLLNKRSAFPGWLALLPTLGAVLLIQAGPAAWLNRAILSHPVVVWFGLISYPLYLWHWPLLAFGHIVEPKNFSQTEKVVAVLLATLLAWLTYRFVEYPIRHGGNDRSKTFLLGGIMAILLVAGLAASQGWIEPRNSGAELGKLVRARTDWQFPPDSFHPYKYGDFTFHSYDADSDGHILMIGDSIAQQYAPRIDELARSGARAVRSVTFATVGGCPPIPGVFRDDNPQCPAAVEAMVQLAHDPRFDTVVVAACWYCYFVYAKQPDSDSPLYVERHGKKVYFKGGYAFEDALSGLERFLRSLTPTKRVILVLSTPSGPKVSPSQMFEGTRLSNAHQKPFVPLTQSEFLEEFGTFREELKAIAARTGVRTIDPMDYLCSADNCTTLSPDGNPLFKDSVHLRSSYVRSEVRYLDELFVAK